MTKLRRNRLLQKLIQMEPSLDGRLVEARHPAGHEFAAAGSAAQALFPCGGVLSILVRTNAGQQVQVNAIGLEGMVALHALSGLKRSPVLIQQQLTGTVLQLPVGALRSAVAAHPAARALVDRWAAFQLTSAHCFVACNALHQARARAARWILMVADRAASDEYPLTQEVLAQMLGVSRQFLSEVAYDFKARGLIDYVRGRMRILKRAALEREACECYALINREYAETVGP